MSSKLSELGKLIFSGSYCPHTAVYKRLTVWVGFPVVLALAAYNIKVELDHARSGHHEEKADYEAFNVRTKAFPWAHGDKCSLFDLECHRRAKQEES